MWKRCMSCFNKTHPTYGFVICTGEMVESDHKALYPEPQVH